MAARTTAKSKTKVSKLKNTHTFSTLQVAIFAVVFAAMGVYIVASSFAARGGGSKMPTATLTVAPNPVGYDEAMTTSFNYSGCGYRTDALSTVGAVYGDRANSNFTMQKPDANGCINETREYVADPRGVNYTKNFWLSGGITKPGTYRVVVKQQVKQGGKWVFKDMGETYLVLQ